MTEIQYEKAWMLHYAELRIRSDYRSLGLEEAWSAFVRERHIDVRFRRNSDVIRHHFERVARGWPF